MKKVLFSTILGLGVVMTAVADQIFNGKELPHSQRLKFMEVLNNNIGTIRHIFNKDENKETLKKIYEKLKKYSNNRFGRINVLLSSPTNNPSVKILQGELRDILSRNERFASDIRSNIFDFSDILFTSYISKDSYRNKFALLLIPDNLFKIVRIVGNKKIEEPFNVWGHSKYPVIKVWINVKDFSFEHAVITNCTIPHDSKPFTEEKPQDINFDDIVFSFEEE